MLGTSLCRRGFAPLVLGLVLAPHAVHGQVVGSNLIYTAIQPCRLIDTRVAGGALAAGVSRAFNVVGVETAGSLTSQGGNPSGCPIPGFANGTAGPPPQVQAVLINFVAVGSAGGGDLVAWPTDHSQPNASIINYTSSAALDFLNIANAVVMPVRQDSQGSDITVLAQVSGTHLVADALGYFTAGSPTGQNSNTFLGAGNVGNPANVTGINNTAMGTDTMAAVTTGTDNSAFGTAALFALTSGNNNTGAGQLALRSLTTGGENTACGYFALDSLLTGNHNIALGDNAGSAYNGAESRNIVIGNNGVVGDVDAIRIGSTQTETHIAGIDGATSSSGTAVFVNGNDRLGTVTSSRRFKEDIADMGDASDDLMRLRPVTFHYKPEYDDGGHLLQYGLVAEEVAQIYPGLVQLGKDGQPLTVRYHFVNAMLLNEVQKQHARIEDQSAQIARQAALLAAQQRRIDELSRRAGEIDALRQELEELRQALAPR